MNNPNENTLTIPNLGIDTSTFLHENVILRDNEVEEYSAPDTGKESDLFKGSSLENPAEYLKSRLNYRYIPNLIPKIDKKFITIQLWEGYIEELDDDKECIIARLSDKTGGGTDEIAEIPYDDVSDNDKELVSQGALFLLSIGYMQNESGQRFKTSNIKFKRFPRFTEKEIESIKNIASQLSLKEDEDK